MPEINYIGDATLNPNPMLTRSQAIDWLVDTGINSEEWEWVGCKAQLCLRRQATREGLEEAIRELAAGNGVRTDAGIVTAVADQLLANAALLDR